MTYRIALTPGEPAGIGPDLTVQLAQQKLEHEIVVFADPELLQQRARQLQLPLDIRLFDPQPFDSQLINSQQPAQASAARQLCVAPVTLAEPCVPGRLNVHNASYVLRCLDAAIDSCTNNQCQALVTGPLHKGVINDAIANNLVEENLIGSQTFFSGHTEYLAARTQTDRVVMMLATDELRVALATTHIPLAQVSANITPPDLAQTITILHTALKQNFGLESPRILVCGLNPHAGEGGHLGKEEVEVIGPVLEHLRQQHMNLIGPLPADTLFTPKVLQQGDAVLAMYHDQGLPVLKYQGFGSAVNITLGLPIIRTSVDHGTALDLATSGKADNGSLQAALRCAAQLIRK